MKILVAPLDWGLGHATRCVPVVREFLRNGDYVNQHNVTLVIEAQREGSIEGKSIPQVDMDTEELPVLNTSYSLSSGFVNVVYFL